MRVAILGCGPAGLLATHAAVMNGATEIRVFSKRRKSELFGAQYLHAPIPAVPHGSGFSIDYRLLGSADVYRAKVYGTEWLGTVSPEDLSEPHDGWDIRKAYDWLWGQYADLVVDFPLDPLSINVIREAKPDIIFNTVPRPVLCKMGHQFKGQKVWAAGDAPERGKTIPYQQVPNNTVWCSGNEETAWYRLSHIDGFRTVEWPDYVRPPIEAAEVMKPLWTNCDCTDDMVNLGRYGRWEKGQLTHHAYQSAAAVMVEAVKTRDAV